MADPKPKFPNLLKEVLAKNERIKEVHFDAKGNHHFNVYNGGDGKQYFGMDVVMSPVKGKDGQFREVRVGRRGTEIVETISADEILSEPIDESAADAAEAALALSISDRDIKAPKPRKPKASDKA